MAKDFKTFNEGTGVIILDKPHHKGMVQLRPTEIYLKEDGSIDNKPSFVIVLTDPISFRPHHPICGQISLEMLNEVMNELGYEVKKINVEPKTDPCLHDWDEGNNGVSKCKTCGKFSA